MAFETVTLLENISAEDTVYNYSDKKIGAGYHRKSSGLHTFQFELENFKGTVKIQGTLELYPGDDDWVDLDFDSGSPLEALDSTPLVANATRNITGNWLWIRAAYILEQGTITKIRFSV